MISLRNLFQLITRSIAIWLSLNLFCKHAQVIGIVRDDNIWVQRKRQIAWRHLFILMFHHQHLGITLSGPHNQIAHLLENRSTPDTSQLPIILNRCNLIKDGNFMMTIQSYRPRLILSRHFTLKILRWLNRTMAILISM